MNVMNSFHVLKDDVKVSKDALDLYAATRLADAYGAMFPDSIFTIEEAEV